MSRLPLAALLLLGAGLPKDEKDRSPHDVALSPDGRWALTANATCDSASLVDLAEGRVVAEVAVGRRPFSVAWRGSRAVVTNWLADTVTVLDVAPPKLAVAATIEVGDEPRGAAIDGDRAFVACSGDDAVAVVDLRARKVSERVAVGDEPWHVALTPDGRRLAVGHALSLDVRVLDAVALKPLHAVGMRGHNLRRLAVSKDGAWAYVCNIAERGTPATRQNIDRGWVIGNRLSRVPLAEEGLRETIALDARGAAVGDPDGVAVSPDGGLLAVAAGGTGELVLLRLPLPFVASGGPGDHIEPELRRDAKRFRRIALGGRPLACAFAPDGRSVVVANYLSNALQVVDVETGAGVTIDLGGAARPSAARLGEAVFYDAKRSFGGWYSCHTCHVDGHTNGATFDTLLDGKYGNSKKTLSLRGVGRTAPYTWHGHQKDLRASLDQSLTTTMQGPKPSAADLDALVAFVSSIEFAPARAPSEAAKRGEGVFKAKGCAKCHAGPDYTAPGVFEVGLESPADLHKGFNPPSLRGAGTRGPWLHDGRARSLEDLLRRHHRPSKLAEVEDPTEEELKELVEFLKSL
jgi:YVTN family beta-propeller protein